MIKLIVDSTSCVDEEYAKQHNISVVHLNVSLDDETRQEGFIQTWDDFFEKLKATTSFPKTSLPSPEEFLNKYNEILADGDEAIVVTLAASLSGTVNSARVAKDMYAHPENIYVVDSGQCSQSELLLIEEIVDLIENKKKSAKEIAEIAEVIKTKLCIEFVPSTIEYLKRGGRMNLLTAAISSVFNIKPILSFKNGVLTCTKKCIGMTKALLEMVKEVPKTVKKIYVCYIHESEFLQPLIDKVNTAFKTNIVEGKKLGPIVGSHIGVGAVGIAFVDSYEY